MMWVWQGSRVNSWLAGCLCWRLAGVVLLPGGGNWMLMLISAAVWWWKLEADFYQCPNVHSVNVQCSKIFTMSYLHFCEFLCNFVQFGSVFPVFALESKSKSWDFAYLHYLAHSGFADSLIFADFCWICWSPSLGEISRYEVDTNYSTSMGTGGYDLQQVREFCLAGTVVWWYKMFKNQLVTQSSWHVQVEEKAIWLPVQMWKYWIIANLWIFMTHTEVCITFTTFMNKFRGRWVPLLRCFVRGCQLNWILLPQWQGLGDWLWFGHWLSYCPATLCKASQEAVLWRSCGGFSQLCQRWSVEASKVRWKSEKIWPFRGGFWWNLALWGGFQWSLGTSKCNEMLPHYTQKWQVLSYIHGT